VKGPLKVIQDQELALNSNYVFDATHISLKTANCTCQTWAIVKFLSQCLLRWKLEWRRPFDSFTTFWHNTPCSVTNTENFCLDGHAVHINSADEKGRLSRCICIWFSLINLHASQYIKQMTSHAKW